VLERRQEREDARDLERAADALARAEERRLVRDLDAVEHDRARRRPVDAGEEVEQRRLAGAVRADDPEKLAFGNLEADIDDDVRAADVEPEVACGENRRVHASEAGRGSYLNGATGGWTLPGETVFSTLTAKCPPAAGTSRTW